jgi:hypothetical protein
MPMFGNAATIASEYRRRSKSPAPISLFYHDELVQRVNSARSERKFDGLGHLGIGDLFYNGNNRADFAQPEGPHKAW